VSRALENHQIDAVLIIGGQKAYEAAYAMLQQRERYPGFRVPVICLPATIDNNLPGWEMAIGADTALNEIVEAADRLKQSAMASRRAFVVEVMGRHCGYLALVGGLSVGAERVYLHEDGVRLADLDEDVRNMVSSFRAGRRFYLAIRNEAASVGYTTDFLCQLFAEESGGDFDVRPMVLGHLQQGGNPTPFDRVHATRLAAFCVDWLSEQIDLGRSTWSFVGLSDGRPAAIPLKTMPDLVERDFFRPVDQWWLGLRPTPDTLAAERPS
jgi:6-phosphofructokinase 1